MHQGVQFFLDFKAPDDFGRYYRVSAEETYEHHATYPIGIYFAGQFFYQPADYSLFTCYSIEPLNNIYLISTKDLNKNQYIKYQMNFVSNQTQRLMYKYSLLVKQMSISDEAYDFWNNLNKNNQESGGLYDTQPALVEGNIYSVSDPNERVLGFFGVSSVKSKRIVVSNIPISFPDDYHCTPSKPNWEGGWPFNTSYVEWPIYFVNYYDISSSSPNPELYVADKDCFDCRLIGGTTVKPDYWDDSLKCNE